MIIGLVASDYLQNKLEEYFNSKGFIVYDFKQLLTKKKEPENRKTKKRRKTECVDILEIIGKKLDLVNKNYVLVNIDERGIEIFDEFDGLTLGISTDLQESWQEMNKEKRRPLHIKNYSQFIAEERKKETKKKSLLELVSKEIEGDFKSICKELDKTLSNQGLTHLASQ